MSSPASSQLNVTVQPNHEVMSMDTFDYQNLQKAAAIATEQHTLANFMDAPTIAYVSTQLTIHQSRVTIDANVREVLSEMIRLNSADAMTTMTDGITQAANTYYCSESYRVTNIIDEKLFRTYYSAVISLQDRHAGAPQEKIKEMIDKLVTNLGKHYKNPDQTQHQVREIQTIVKAMPESGRRTLTMFLNQVSEARLRLITHIASCNNMKMLKDECLLTTKEKRGREGDEYNNIRGNKRMPSLDKDRQTVDDCNHCGKKHAPPCGLMSHPDCNPDTNIKWSESDKGKAWKEKGYDMLQPRQLLNGQAWDNPNPFHLQPKSTQYKQQHNHGNRNSHHNSNNFRRHHNR